MLDASTSQVAKLFSEGAVNAKIVLKLNSNINLKNENWKYFNFKCGKNCLLSLQKAMEFV
jgi:hypothetical protein